MFNEKQYATEILVNLLKIQKKFVCKGLCLKQKFYLKCLHCDSNNFGICLFMIAKHLRIWRALNQHQCKKVICCVLTAFSKCSLFCLKEQLNHVHLFSPFDKKFNKSHVTSDFRDFTIIFTAEPLFIFFAALLKILKQQSATKSTRRQVSSLCFLCSFDKNFKVAICNKVNLQIGKLNISLHARS